MTTTHDLTRPVSRRAWPDRHARRRQDGRREHVVRRGRCRRYAHQLRRRAPASARSATSARRRGRATRRSCCRTCHWDHTCGLPFFTPIYVPGTSHRDRERPQRRDAARPKRSARCSARRSSRSTSTTSPAPSPRASCARTIGSRSATSRSRWRSSTIPIRSTAIRLEHGGQSIVYATDTEHFCVRRPGAQAQPAAGADILIYDSQYTPEEYPGQASAGATRRGSPAPSSRAPPACRSSCCSITTRAAPTIRSRRSRPPRAPRCPARSRRARA